MEKQFPTGEAVFSHDFVVTPESCDEGAGLSPLGVFTMLQSIATQHAELLGVGGAAMAKRGAFWLTVHNRVDFYDRAYLMQTVRASTWAEACAEKDVRCFRSYTLRCGDKLVAVGRTQWAVLGAAGRVVPFARVRHGGGTGQGRYVHRQRRGQRHGESGAHHGAGGHFHARRHPA